MTTGLPKGWLALACFGIVWLILLTTRERWNSQKSLKPQVMLAAAKSKKTKTIDTQSVATTVGNEPVSNELVDYPYFQRCDSPKHKGFQGWKCSKNNKYCMGDPYGVNTCAKLFRLCQKHIDCRCHPNELENPIDPYLCQPKPTTWETPTIISEKKLDRARRETSPIDLHPNWVPPPSCLRKANTPRDPSEKFLVVLNVGMPGEQQSKNIGAIAMMANLARKLGRTLVEPATCNGYITSPFLDPNHAPEPLRKVAGHYSPWGSCKNKVGLSALWDLTQACQQVKIMPLHDFQALASPTEPYPWGINFTSDDYRCIPKSCQHVAEYRILKRIKGNQLPEEGRVVYVYAYQRELQGLGGKGVCTTKECYGLKFSVPLPITRYVQDVYSRVGNYVCINWRTETHLNGQNVDRCIKALLSTIKKATGMHSMSAEEKPLFLLLSDLLPGHSMSYKRSRPQAVAVEAIENFILGDGKKMANSGVMGGNDASRRILESAATNDVDLGVIARLQQLLCANADYVVGLNNDAGNTLPRSCGRGIDSGFVAGMIHARQQLGKSMKENETNGFFPFFDHY
eukprot:m.24200 g.24200  ORF g.24200 m.24200 type:complete len:569 (-) comp7585_c0_seq1:1221-2927(-)